MISSIDLFFSRDCAGGRGPVVEAPRLALAFAASSAPEGPVADGVVVVGMVGVLTGGLSLDSDLLGKIEPGGPEPGILLVKLGKRDGADADAEEVAVAELAV